MIRYYAGKLIEHYASLPIGGKAVIVSRFKWQPYERYKELAKENKKIFAIDTSKIPSEKDCIGNNAEYFLNWFHARGYEFKFPIGSTIGMPETWYTSIPNSLRQHKRPSSTMPSSEIRLLFQVTGTRVCEVQKVTFAEILMTKIKPTDMIIIGGKVITEYFRNWYLTCYSDGNWGTDWAEVTTVKRLEKL